MKKTFIILAFIVSIINKANAQTIKINYEVKANVESQVKNIQDPETRQRVAAHLSQPRYFELYYLNGEINYIQKNAPLENDKTDEIPLQDGGKTYKKVEVGNTVGAVYINRLKNLYIQSKDLLGKQFLIKDTVFNFKWNLYPEERKIGNFDCKKAKAVSGRDTITAWYTTSIPVNVGPDMYGNLPGLIVELQTPTQVYKALSIDKNVKDFTFLIPNTGKVVSRQTFNTLRDEKIKELKQGNGQALFGN
jgi:GLPGLI family protein